MNTQSIRHVQERGFTMFFAVLIASLALAVGLAIYDLTARELDLSSVSAQSQYAIYAADTGVECALYWDAKYWHSEAAATSSVFATSSLSSVPSSGVFCDSQDIAPTIAAASANAATTTFSLQFVGRPYCARVSVAKYIGAGNAPRTTVSSYGYNTCTESQNRVERLLQASY